MMNRDDREFLPLIILSATVLLVAAFLIAAAAMSVTGWTPK